MQIQERDKLYYLVAWELDFVCCLQKCKLSLSSFFSFSIPHPAQYDVP